MNNEELHDFFRWTVLECLFMHCILVIRFHRLKFGVFGLGCMLCVARTRLSRNASECYVGDMMENPYHLVWFL